MINIVASKEDISLITEIAKDVLKTAIPGCGFQLEYQFHYPRDITPLMARTMEQYAIFQVRDNQPVAFYIYNQAFTIKRSFFMYGDERPPECFENHCIESHSLIDGTTAYLFRFSQS